MSLPLPGAGCTYHKIWGKKFASAHCSNVYESSGLPKVIFLAVAKAEGEGGKTLTLEVKAEGEAEGFLFGI